MLGKTGLLTSESDIRLQRDAYYQDLSPGSTAGEKLERDTIKHMEGGA